MKEAKLIIKKAATHQALSITSLIVTVPFLFLWRYPNLYLLVIFTALTLVLYFKLKNEIAEENPIIVFENTKITFNKKKLIYEELKSFSFTMAKYQVKSKIDLNWWAEKILILTLITNAGDSYEFQIPNKLNDYNLIKNDIIQLLKSKGVLENETNFI